jgi:hypothetical protein
MYLQECVVARGARTDQRWDAGVGDGGGKSGGNAREWCSLDVDHDVDVDPAERGQHDTSSEEDCRDGRSGEAWRQGDPQDLPPPEKTWYGGFE